MIRIRVQNVGLHVGKPKICRCLQGATSLDENSKSMGKSISLGNIYFSISVMKLTMNIVMLGTTLLLVEHSRLEVLPSKLIDATTMTKTKVIML